MLFAFACVICFAGNTLAQGHNKDTIYKFGNFLIHPTDTMNIDFIVKGKPLKHHISQGDTLYEDRKYLILGNVHKAGYYENYGVFKKYTMPYKFSDFKASVYKGKLAAPDFKTDPPARLFRTQIKTQCKTKGINFGGHYTLVEWGCGSSCLTIALVDRISGKISYSGIQDVCSPFYELAYKPNSTIIIINNWMLEGIKDYLFCSRSWQMHIARWDSTRFECLPVYGTAAKKHTAFVTVKPQEVYDVLNTVIKQRRIDTTRWKPNWSLRLMKELWHIDVGFNEPARSDTTTEMRPPGTIDYKEMIGAIFSRDDSAFFAWQNRHSRNFILQTGKIDSIKLMGKDAYVKSENTAQRYTQMSFSIPIFSLDHQKAWVGAMGPYEYYLVKTDGQWRIKIIKTRWQAAGEPEHLETKVLF